MLDIRIMKNEEEFETAASREIIGQMLKGPVTEDISASVLQLHPSRTFPLDVEAGRYAANMEGARLC